MDPLGLPVQNHVAHGFGVKLPIIVNKLPANYKPLERAECILDGMCVPTDYFGSWTVVSAVQGFKSACSKLTYDVDRVGLTSTYQFVETCERNGKTSRIDFQGNNFDYGRFWAYKLGLVFPGGKPTAVITKVWNRGLQNVAAVVVQPLVHDKIVSVKTLWIMNGTFKS